MERRKRFKRKHGEDPPRELHDKVAAAGGPHGFGLEYVSTCEMSERANVNEARESGVYGSRSTASLSTLPRIRLFGDDPSARHVKSKNGSVGLQNPYHHISQSKRSSVTSFASLRKAKLTSSRIGHPVAVHIACAISENLARETCVASIDAGSPVSLMVTKQANGQTYAETLAYLEILQPDEVLLNEGRRNSQLAKKVLQLYRIEQGVQLPYDGAPAQNAIRVGDSANGRQDEDPRSQPCDTASTVVKFISRSCFDQTKGSELLRRVVREETFDASYLEEYILLSSTHALLHYTQQCLGATFSKNSLQLTVNSGGNNRMTIDRSTVFQLELLANARTGKMRNSLISTIDCTTTTVGGRLLRANLMSPPTRVDTINTRLDLVDAFLSDEDFFYSVLEHLQTLPDIDKMLTNIALIPRKKSSKGNSITESEAITDRVANKGISALVCVKSTLAGLPAFANALDDRLRKLELKESQDERDHSAAIGSPDSGRRSILIGLGGSGQSMVTPRRHHLLRAIISTMRQSTLTQVYDLVSDIFTESTSYSRNANAMRHHACFALKSESNGIMEVCRKAFLANVDDIYKLADEYAETHAMHVTVKHTAARGYFLSIPLEHALNLPQEFIQPTKCARAISCTTEEVYSLNLRAQENVQDLLLMTHEKIQEVLDVARSHYDSFAALSDAVALLDMCHSFADVVARSRLPWCRPIVYDSNEKAGTSHREEMALTIVNGRYAIDSTSSALAGSSGPGEFIPNDTFASRSKHFTVITGINGSGKSTYLKQVAIIVLLSHCGSYVPAENATIPIMERLCTRIGTTDDQEHNISTFLLEMKETAFICQNASPKSLILIDELGRATSNEDGVAIAWSVSEFLIKKQAITFFVTHYPQLCSLANIYSSVQNQHLEAKVSEEGGDVVLYTHRLSQGPCNLSSNYGVEMAESCGWEKDVLGEARRLRSIVERRLTQAGTCNVQLVNNLEVTRSRAHNALASMAVALQELACSDWDGSTIRSKLDAIRKTAHVDQDMIDGIRLVLLDAPTEKENTEHRPVEKIAAQSSPVVVRGRVAQASDSEGSSRPASAVSSLLTSTTSTSEEGTSMSNDDDDAETSGSSDSTSSDDSTK